MNASIDRGPRPERGPAMYYGYCADSGRYRLMDLPDYMASVQQGVSKLMTDVQTAYQDAARGLYDALGRGLPSGARRPATHDRGCGCDDCRQPGCHCQCCVCDADVLVHARCGEVRRIPVTFANDTRRERPVTLELEKFVTSGGRDLQWSAELSTSSFTLRPCDGHTVIVTVSIRCREDGGSDAPAPGRTAAARQQGAATTGADRGRVDRCEVGYATLRADGCLIRPVVLAVAVLPDDCDAYRRPCGCSGCH